MTSDRVVNFSPGPATLPEPVLARVREDLPPRGETGASVMEMSHRSSEYAEIHDGARDRLRRLLEIPESFEILLLQGGASLQFSMAPMTLMGTRRSADYVVTGRWSRKAVAEARKHGAVRIAASTEHEEFRRIPDSDELDLDPTASYLHLTSNNTVVGTQWRGFPEARAPLVADMSSDILSRPVPWDRFGLAYAGAQKNLGPAGVTVVVLRKELLDRAPDDLPTMLDYRIHAEKDSRYNTPPTFPIYVLGLVLEWVDDRGGLEAMERRARQRSEILYQRLDESDFYRGTVEPGSRSRMNVTFRLPSQELEEEFLAAAEDAGMVNLKGHRSVGGIRASLYNAMSREGVERLAGLMEEFQADHG
ncbi:MAG: 3-phosphoserine/phosphohydroxythreonine transaminase [Thermoanaerobaculia bacterium]|nr:3-phosphoserine/phosphohydroxythreonine transaminase [Thermoanaerobaculia bacterium]